MSKRKEILDIVLCYIGTMLGVLAVRFFNVYVMMSIPLIPRMAVIIAMYWVIALAAIIITLIRKEPAKTYGLFKDKMLIQIGIGVAIALAMSVVFTLVPHLAGFGQFFDTGNRYEYLWQYIFEFTYCILSVGFVEEFVFRGFIFGKLQKICRNNVLPVVISSALFGFFHIFNGSIFQVLMTAGIGALFCLCRLKIKNCSTLSLVIAHGVYDALITVWANVLLK